MFCRNEGILKSYLVVIVQILKGKKTFGDRIRGEELCIPCKPIHLVHFFSDGILRRPQKLNAVDHLLIDKSLCEGP